MKNEKSSGKKQAPIPIKILYKNPDLPDYETLIKKNDTNSIKDVLEYTNVLSSNSSSKFIKNPNDLGRAYAYNTNEKCINVANPTGKLVDRHTFVKAFHPAANGLLAAANLDFEKSKNDINYLESAKNSKFPKKCMSVSIVETDIDGNTVTNPYYMMIADIDDIPNNMLKDEKKPALPIISGFSNMQNDLDFGQTFFVGSLGIIGLYMYFRMLYGSSK